MEMNKSTLLTKLDYSNKNVANMNAQLAQKAQQAANSNVAAPQLQQNPNTQAVAQVPVNTVVQEQPLATQATQPPAVDMVPIIPPTNGFGLFNKFGTNDFPYKKQLVIGVIFFVCLLMSNHSVSEKVTAFLPENMRKPAIYLLLSVCAVIAYTTLC